MVRGSGFALGFALALATATAATAARADATYQTLYTFTGGTDGDHPQSGLAMDADGNLYGTAPHGGADGLGTLFKLAPGGDFTLLHTFKGGRDGAVPTAAALTLDAHGTIYGMTEQGGRVNGGTAYRFKNGRMTVLHAFGIGNDGYLPRAGLLPQPDGSFVGVTVAGGGSGCESFRGCGTIFRLASDGTVSVLHAFAGGDGDGSGPTGTPVRDRAGNLYGTTVEGGHGDKGALYKLAPDGSESVLYFFNTAASYPYQGLTIDKHGSVYGSVQMSNNTSAGSIFKLDAKGRESTMYKLVNGPGYGTGLPGMVRDPAGNLYGTLSVGGGNQTGDCHFAGGCGALFLLAPDKTMTVLHGFGGTDGQYPEGGVIRDAAGNFYGTTMWGGAAGHGTIFKITMGTK